MLVSQGILHFPYILDDFQPCGTVQPLTKEAWTNQEGKTFWTWKCCNLGSEDHVCKDLFKWHILKQKLQSDSP